MTAPGRRLTRASGRYRAAAPVRLVHLGLGNFFRAHQAWYTDQAPDAADWGIAAFSGRSAALAESLSAQDGLYTLITQAPDGIWGAGSQSFLFRYDRDLEQVFVRYPPRSLLCSRTQSFDAVQESIQDVAYADGYIFFIRSACNSVIAVRLEDHCTSLLPIDADEPSTLERSFRKIHASERTVVVVGSGGRAYVLDL